MVVVESASAAGMLSVGSAAFDIDPATLEFTQQPTTTTAGGTITPAVTVTARDAQGNVATGFDGKNVTVAIKSGTGATGAGLDGTTTQPTSVGVATFGDLDIDEADTGYVLEAIAGSLIVVSTTFNVTL